jgi:hypothetical protein
MIRGIGPGYYVVLFKILHPNFREFYFPDVG